MLNNDIYLRTKGILAKNLQYKVCYTFDHTAGDVNCMWCDSEAITTTVQAVKAMLA